jgi:acetyl-CoA carboxylase biotin carboxyl carrier protein
LRDAILSDKKSKRKPRKSPAQAASQESSGGGPMDVGVLEKLVKLMRANDLTTVEVADGDRRILLKRGGEAVAFAPSPMGHAPAKSAAAPIEPKADEDAGLVPIKSIMVGTYYAAPAPDAPPFVSVGTSVDEETDVCVIEAMKVFNTIKADCRGTIAKVLVTNGQSVEFGQPLFLVKP